MNKRNTGDQKEQAVCECLTRHGWIILERNFRTRAGEIDIVAREGETLVFVEVKYRADVHCGLPSEAVDARKQGTISHVALVYLLRHHMCADTPCRFDIAAVTGNHLHLIRDAFPVTTGRVRTFSV